MTLKTWMPTKQKNTNTYPGNNIVDPRNKTAIETYNAVEGNKVLDKKYPGLNVRYRGKRV